MDIGAIGGLIGGLVASLISGLVNSFTPRRTDRLINGIVFGLIFGVTFRLIFGVLFGLIGLSIVPHRVTPLVISTKDELKWSFQSFFFQLKHKLSTIFIFLLGIVIFVLIASSIDHWSEHSLLGIRIELKEWVEIGFYIFIYFGPVIWIVATIIGMLYNNYANLLQITTPYQRFTASMRSLHFSILQHFHLRWLLYKKGLLPLRLVTFLNEMTERHILESDGATWRFRHRILQEYFANQWTEPAEKTV